jgi:hypothetical protein
MAQKDRTELRQKVANLEGTLARIQFRDSLTTYRNRFIRAFRNLEKLPHDKFSDKKVLEIIAQEMNKNESALRRQRCTFTLIHRFHNHFQYFLISKKPIRKGFPNIELWGFPPRAIHSDLRRRGDR